MTVQKWIDETRDMLLSGYVEELLLLASGVDVAATTLSVTGAADSGIITGVIIEINTEAMYVTAVSGTDVSVIRGYGTSTAASHSANDVVRISPKFPAYRILEALNNDLRDLSAPDNGLFEMKSLQSITYNVAKQGYDLTGLTSEGVQSIYSISYTDPIVVEAREPEIRKWSLKRDRATTAFASGLALVLHEQAFPGKKLNITYKAPLTLVSSTTDTKASTGLQSTAYDLPPLGAALSLMTAAPIRREFLDAEGSSRLAADVPPGAISASMRDLRLRRQNRIAAEAARLSAMYPQKA